MLKGHFQRSSLQFKWTHSKIFPCWQEQLVLQRLPRRAKSLHKGISANFTTGDNGCEKGGGLPKVIVQVGATAEAAVAADAALGVEGSAAADVARGPMQGRASKKFFRASAESAAFSSWTNSVTPLDTPGSWRCCCW